MAESPLRHTLILHLNEGFGVPVDVLVELLDGLLDWLTDNWRDVALAVRAGPAVSTIDQHDIVGLAAVLRGDQ